VAGCGAAFPFPNSFAHLVWLSEAWTTVYFSLSKRTKLYIKGKVQLILLSYKNKCEITILPYSRIVAYPVFLKAKQAKRPRVNLIFPCRLKKGEAIRFWRGDNRYIPVEISAAILRKTMDLYNSFTKFKEKEIN
jgi:hypothetical protein